MKAESKPLLNTTKMYVAFGILIVLLLYTLIVAMHHQNVGFMQWSEQTDKSILPMASSLSSLSPSSSSSSSSSNRTQQQPKQQQVLLVTQGRSGSSFTSALLAQDESVFYSFEPLYPLQKLVPKDPARSSTHDLGKRRGAVTTRPSNAAYKRYLPEVQRKRVHGVLKAYLTCDFMNISAIDLNSNFHTRTQYGTAFIKCERNKATGFIHIQCLSNLVRLCRSRAVSFSKVIRFPMRWAEALLNEIPHLKILYLVRDPRAVIYSQSLNFPGSFNWPDGLQPAVTKYCERIKEDFREIGRLSSLFPNRLRLIRYENGALNPLAYARNIFKFVGLEFTNKTKAYISSLQSSNVETDRNAYGVKRSNATKVVNKWRQSPGSYRAAKVIDASCSQVYSKAGYIKVTSQTEVSSTTKPLFTEPETFSTLQAAFG